MASGTRGGSFGTKHLETKGFNGARTSRSDLDVVDRKIEAARQAKLAVGNVLKRREKELTESELEVSECRLHWDILQAQITELGKQLGGEIYKVHREVGDMLKRESSLSIDMYYFL